MYIYLISPKQNNQDSILYDHAIVIANNADEARFIHPLGDEHIYTDAPNVAWHNTETSTIDEFANDIWPKPENVNVIELGTANDDILDAASENNFVISVQRHD